MAATDKFYRDQKKLNVLFAVSCVLMLVSILWMLWADYNREYKKVQRLFRDVEEAVSLTSMLENLPPESETYAAIDEVQGRRDVLEKTKKSLEDDLQKLNVRRDNADNAYQTIKQDYDSMVSYRDADVKKIGLAKTDSERTAAEAKIADWDSKLAKLKAKLDETFDERLRAFADIDEKITRKLAPLQQALSEAEDTQKRLTANLDRFGKLAAEKKWKAGDTFRNLPVIDAFAAPIRINQFVLADLPIEYGTFKYVTRYDRCTTCHLSVDRAPYSREILESLGDAQRVKDLNARLKTAKDLFTARADKGEKLPFHLEDLPDKLRTVKLSAGQVTQFAAHPRLDLFIDPNSAHPMESFGCTICHGGQGSSTSFNFASHTPNDAYQKERWESGGRDGYHWEFNHNWDFPMSPKRFTESNCLKCHHQVTDLIRQGNKEEAPKLLHGYNLVRENGCFGCHEIAGVKAGKTIGPDMRIEPTPPLEWLPPEEQRAARADAQNPPGTLRKVGPSLRRVYDKTTDQWLQSWIRDPRGFRPDTRMPHFYGQSTNRVDVLPSDQKDYPDAEVFAIAYYLRTESKMALGLENPTPRGKDAKDRPRENADLAKNAAADQMEKALTTLREARRSQKVAQARKAYRELRRLIDLPETFDRTDPVQEGGELQRKFAANRKFLDNLARRYRDLALLSNHYNRVVINDIYARLQLAIEQGTDLNLDVADGDRAFQTMDESFIALREAGKPVPGLESKGYLVDSKGNALPRAVVDGLKTEPAAGKALFIEKGCLACHTHLGVTVPKKVGEDRMQVISAADFGPDLTRIAAKLTGPESRVWLIQWILNPNVYHPRTRMPITHLEPQQAADIADFLLAQAVDDWKPENSKLSEGSLDKALQELAEMSLSKTPGIGRLHASGVLKSGLGALSANLAPDADEQLLAGDSKPDRSRLARYVGKKAIGRQGCFGCHDIPGFETSKPIGTPLNDWGKKDPDRLAFEEADSFVKAHFKIVEARDDARDPDRPAGDWHGDGMKLYEKFFAEAVHHHNREGFLHLKLAEPKSFDYGRDRTWDDRLRMPQFKFAHLQRKSEYDQKEDKIVLESLKDFRERLNRKGQDQGDDWAQFEEARAREAVMTFILGLVAEPIPSRYVNASKGDRLAEVKGRQVLDKFNCAGCHEIRSGTYEFNIPEADRKTILAGLKADLEKLAEDHYFPDSNAWKGRTPPAKDKLLLSAVSQTDGPARVFDPETKQWVYQLLLTEAVPFVDDKGMTLQRPAGESLTLPERLLRAHSEPYGGAFARLLPDYLARDESRYGTRDKQRSGLPPPLLREGERVRGNWLYHFLLEPIEMRPYVKLRMPKFNMSDEEATALADYFSSVDRLNNPGLGLTEPFLSVPQQSLDFWRDKNKLYVQKLGEKGMKEAVQQLGPVWKRKVADEITAMERQLEGTAALIEQLTKDRENAPDDTKKKEAAQKLEDATKNRDATQKRINELKDEQKLIDKNQFTSVDFDLFKNNWGQNDVYAGDAYRLITDARSICMTCHSVGDLKIVGEQGPNLKLASERLRPEWTLHWIANPRRMFTYPPLMPQNFPRGKPVDPHFLDGDALQTAEAARNAIMDLRRLTDLPVNKYRVAPKGGNPFTVGP